MNISKLTLADLLTITDEIIQRNAMSILKRLNSREYKDKTCRKGCAYHDEHGNCTDVPF